MQTLLSNVIATNTLFTSAQAAACGISRHGLDRLVRSGQLRRVGPAMFVPADLWRGASPQQRHVWQARSALSRYRGSALSHHSAAILHGMAVYRVTLSLVHVSRATRGRAGRVGRRHPVQVHPALLPEAYTAVDGLRTCVAPIAPLQIADWHGVDSGMVSAESALHLGLCTQADLQLARGFVRLGAGRANADFVVANAGNLSESPGETLTKLLLMSLGIDDFEQQATVQLPGGGSARVDFLLPDRAVVIEFDGAVKYEAAQGRRALVGEKTREDGIRATGLRVVRLVWSYLDRPAYVQQLIDG